jgi:hypothetical protein
MVLPQLPARRKQQFSSGAPKRSARFADQGNSVGAAVDRHRIAKNHFAVNGCPGRFAQ